MMRLRAKSRYGEVLGWILAGSVLAWIGRGVLTTNFMPYDDEGYVQWALRQVAGGHALYTDVFSQYGPFFHTFHIWMAKLGYPFTSDSARMLAGVYWWGSALGAGLLTRRLTGNGWLGIGGFLLTFLAMTQMHAEPGHPGGLLALLSAWSAYLGVAWIQKGGTRTFGRWQGVIAACMFWTKINVGVLQLVATATWWPFAAPKMLNDNWRRALRAVIALVGGGLLVTGLIEYREVQIYLLFFVCAAGALAWTWPATASSSEPAAPAFKAAAWGFGIASAISCGFVLLGGTRPMDLIEGTLLGPIRHPGVYHFLVPWTTVELVLIGCSASAVVLFKLGPARCRIGVLIAVKSLAIVLLARAALRAEYGQIERTMFMHLPALAWALAIPLREPDINRRQARHWLGWLLCWSWLQSYPVAGTQYVWGAFLAIPLTLTGAHDLVSGRARPWFSVAVLGLGLFGTVNVGRYVQRYLETGEPLDLPGAHSLRLNRPITSTYRLLVQNAQANGTMLFSFPGMLSFNQWSGLPAPTTHNATHWFSLLTTDRQEKIIERLKASESPVIIVCRSQIHYLFDQGLAPEGPLNDFIFRDFEPGLRVGDYDIWKRRGAPFTPLSCARVLEANDAIPEKQLVMITTAGNPVMRAEIVDLTRPSEILLALEHTDGWRQRVLPAKLQPEAGMQAERVAQRLIVPLDRTQSVPDLASIEIRLLDMHGAVLDRLRIDHAPRPASAFTVSLPESAN